MTDRRVKTDPPQLGPPSEGTVRGQLRLRPSQSQYLISDRAKDSPNYGRFEIWEDGRDFELTAITSTTLVVTGDVVDYLAAGDEIEVLDSGSANGTYLVQAGTTYSDPSTTINVDGPVGSFTAGDTPRATIRFTKTLPNRPHRDQVRTIVGLTAGDDGEIQIIIPSPDPDGPLCGCNMFLIGDDVLIKGTADGLNDGEWKCRADYIDAAGQRTIKLTGYVNAGGTGGTVTLLLPPPQRIKQYGKLVLRMARVIIPTGAICWGRRIDQRGNWYEVICGDPLSSDPLPPETP